MSRYTRGLLAVILAVVLVLPAAAFAMLPEANARSSTGMDGPTMTGKVADYDTSNHWKFWAGGYDGKETTTQNVGRIWTDKTVKAVEGGESDFLTTLSAISSTSDTTISAKPLDIVMVLDASGSMDKAMSASDSTKRIKALKTAANSFIDTIAEQNAKISDESKPHQVAIVKFAGTRAGWVGNDTYWDSGYRYNYSQTMKKLTPCNKDEGAESLKNTVNSISPNGATRADYGLQLADEVFSSGRADAKKIVVFFTDGSPTSSSGFEASVANSAINSAKSLKAKDTDIYTIGIFDGADPNAVPAADGTSKENKFMHAVSSNYPDAESYTSDKLGTRAENANYYKSATSAAELEKIFEEISGSIIKAGYPTEVHDGYGEHKSGYITFTDKLGDFMQVDTFTSVVYNGAKFENPSKMTEGNVDTYTFTGDAANLVITVQHAEEGKPRTGDIVTVKIPASLIPLRHFKITDGVLTVDETEPIQVSYTSSVKKDALNNLFTPESVPGLEDYIKSNTTTTENDSKTVSFYANKWSDSELGDTIANFEPAGTNRYYYFQKQTPIYTDEDCKTPATGSLDPDGTYYYKDEFEAKGAGGKAESRTAVIKFKGKDAASFKGAIVSDDASKNLSFSKGTARLAFIDELHTAKNPNVTRTASDVLNPRWNDTSSKEAATHVNSHLGNNGKISFAYNMTPATVDTKAKFGLTKVLEGRDWRDTDRFEFGLTSEGNAPMPEFATVPVTKGDLDDKGKAAINFGMIEYTEPGTYVYKVSEKNAGTTVDGIAYSKNVAEITVTVTPNKKGELSADVKVAWSEAGETEFKNVYTAESVESSVTDKIDVTKSLTGCDLAAGEFSFELAEIVDKEFKPVETVTNNANGKVTFSPIRYTEIGQHTYRLREVPGDAGNGITYDSKTYTIVTTIADNGKGQLVATHELKDAEDVKDAKSIEFKNAYTTNAAEASLVGKKNLQVPDGLTPADITGKFTFTVIGEEGAPMPASRSVHNDADGKVDFGEITFKLDDLNNALGEKPEKREHTFTYTVTESGEVAGVTNDAKLSREVSFTVTDDGKGKLSVSRNPDGNAAFTFTNTYSVKPVETSVTDQITATKVLTGRTLKDGEFSFELVEGDKVVAKGTNAADGKITMSKITYDKPGTTHTYMLREVNGGTTSKGITYSDAKYAIETTITDNGDGTLKAEHVLKGDKPATFENTYSVTPTDAELDFGLSKAIDGREWTDGDEFSFTITAPDGTPLPNPATVTVSKRDTKDGIAAIKFGKIRYTAAGTYKYEIRENAGSTVGMTYDAHVATAEVTVTEDGDGTLTANVTKKENGRFTNTYRTELNYTAAGGLKLSKTLRGRPMTEGQFTFTVTPANEASANALGLLPVANEFKSPATAEGTVGLIDILAGHEVKFTQADAGKTFTYTVAEKNDGQPGYTYDDAVRTVTIAIADDTAGTLTATTTVSGGSEGTLVTEYKTGAAAVESAVIPFVNSYSATTNTTGGEAAQVVATKTLTGRPMADGEFYFGIAYAGEKEAIEGTCTTNVNEHVSFGSLHYTTEMLADLVNAKRAIRTDKDAKLTWTIGYTAFEFTPQLAAKGITAATPSFSFKVIVVDNGDGTLTAKPVYDGIKPLFENVYGTDAVDAALAGTKKLQAAEGLTPADIAGKFTFTVAADEAGAPMPERTTATNDAAGNVDFGKIHFTLEDLNRALGVKTHASDDVSSDAEANADEAEVDTDENDSEVNGDESDANDESDASGESKPAAPIAPRSHTFTYTVTESGSAPGVTNDANATRKVSYTVTDDGAGHLSVKREGADGAAFTFTNTYSVAPTDSVVTDQVKTVKRLTGRDLAAGEFTFELLEGGVVVASGTNDVNGNVTLNPIHYEAPGTHTYTLREACPNALGLYKGVTYDSTTYTIVTIVSDNGDGTLTATHKLEGTTESAGFTNKYHAMPTQVSIGAIKVLEGRELKKDEFSFKLVGEDIESTVTNDADGKINFDKFEYDEPGTYVYTISEVKGDETGMTYDKSVFTATVNVVDGGEGNLKASVAYTKGDKSVEGIVFNNTYKKPETPVPTPDPGTPKTVTNIVKTVKGFLPTTGDQQAAALLMAFVVAMSGVGALIWGIRKR